MIERSKQSSAYFSGTISGWQGRNSTASST